MPIVIDDQPLMMFDDQRLEEMRTLRLIVEGALVPMVQSLRKIEGLLGEIRDELVGKHVTMGDIQERVAGVRSTLDAMEEDKPLPSSAVYAIGTVEAQDTGKFLNGPYLSTDAAMLYFMNLVMKPHQTMFLYKVGPEGNKPLYMWSDTESRWVPIPLTNEPDPGDNELECPDCGCAILPEEKEEADHNNKQFRRGIF